VKEQRTWLQYNVERRRSRITISGEHKAETDIVQKLRRQEKGGRSETRAKQGTARPEGKQGAEVRELDKVCKGAQAREENVLDRENCSNGGENNHTAM